MKKYLLMFLTLISFILMSVLISNVQSNQAQFTLEANGLSKDAREITTTKDYTIASLINHLQKTAPKNKIQVQLSDKTNSDRVLIWSNYDLPTLPIVDGKGRYFNQSDFSSDVTFAVISKNSAIPTLNTQDHQYVKQNNQYIAVIGTLKESSIQKQYFISTGPKQTNNREKLGQFVVLIDGLNKNQLIQLSKFLDGKVTEPLFIKKINQQKQVPIWQFGLTIFLVVVIIGTAILIGIQLTSISLRSHVHGNLLQRLLTNKSIRYVGLSLLLFLLTILFANYVLYFSSFGDYFSVISLVWGIHVLSFVMTVIFMRRKEH